MNHGPSFGAATEPISHAAAVIGSTNRIEFIERYVRGKRVLHVGCADAPFTLDRMRRGNFCISGCGLARASSTGSISPKRASA